jgi:hypothetical protein
MGSCCNSDSQDENADFNLHSTTCLEKKKAEYTCKITGTQSAKPKGIMNDPQKNKNKYKGTEMHQKIIDPNIINQVPKIKIKK